MGADGWWKSACPVRISSAIFWVAYFGKAAEELGWTVVPHRCQQVITQRKVAQSARCTSACGPSAVTCSYRTNWSWQWKPHWDLFPCRVRNSRKGRSLPALL